MSSPSESQHNVAPEAVAMAYVKTISGRVDRIETDFVDHVRKIDGRLDQIVSLVRDVSALKQQYVAQNEALSELRSAMREQSQRVESSVARVHQRLDELTATLNSNIDSEAAKLSGRITDGENNHTDLDQRFHMWLNRGIGGWMAFVLILGAIQFIGMRWLTTMEAERNALQEQVVTLKTRVIDLENQSLQRLNRPIPKP